VILVDLAGEHKLVLDIISVVERYRPRTITLQKSLGNRFRLVNVFRPFFFLFLGESIRGNGI